MSASKQLKYRFPLKSMWELEKWFMPCNLKSEVWTKQRGFNRDIKLVVFNLIQMCPYHCYVGASACIFRRLKQNTYFRIPMTPPHEWQQQYKCQRKSKTLLDWSNTEQMKRKYPAGMTSGQTTWSKNVLRSYKATTFPTYLIRVVYTWVVSQ